MPTTPITNEFGEPISYPANWETLPATEKINWVKQNFQYNPKSDKAWREGMANKFAGKSGSTTIAPMLGVAAVGAAGLIGAMAIRRAKKRFDTEINDWQTGESERHAQLVNFIRGQRERKLKSNL